jgi:hypothetical protein
VDCSSRIAGAGNWKDSVYRDLKNFHPRNLVEIGERGMLAARGHIRVMCDADCSMPPEEMPKLLAHIGSGAAQIAIGSRYADGAKTDADKATESVFRIGATVLSAG